MTKQAFGIRKNTQGRKSQVMPAVSVTSLRDRGMDEPFTVAAPACSHLASVTQRGASNEDTRKDCIFTVNPSEPVMERDGSIAA